MKVSDIMTLGVATVVADANLSAAAKTMLNHRIRSLPVVDPTGKRVGILTESDLMRALASDRSWASNLGHGQPTRPAVFESTRVADVMSPIVTTIDGNAQIDEAIRLIADHSLHHLPVLDGEKLSGMLSPADILQAAVEPRSPSTS